MKHTPFLIMDIDEFKGTKRQGEHTTTYDIPVKSITWSDHKITEYFVDIPEFFDSSRIVRQWLPEFQSEWHDFIKKKIEERIFLINTGCIRIVGVNCKEL